MRARVGVRKGQSGGGMSFDPDRENLLVVWDLDAEGYRMIPADAVVELTHHGQRRKYNLATGRQRA